MFARWSALLMILALASAVNAADQSDLEAQVRATEVSFAKTLADRDVKKFASMIAPDAIWLADKPLHGPDEVLTRWQKFFEGPKAPFSWYPEVVDVQKGGALALSTGPVVDPNGKRVGTFTSIWRHESNGEWKLIFDRGCPVCGCDPPK
jgi:ketosteroid isomerase-like protein